MVDHVSLLIGRIQEREQLSSASKLSKEKGRGGTQVPRDSSKKHVKEWLRTNCLGSNPVSATY